MIDFPDTPVVDDVFTSGSLNWQWDGVKWKPFAALATLLDPGDVLGNPDVTPTAASPTPFEIMLRTVFGDGTAGDLFTSGGAGIDPAWESPTALVLPTLTQGELLGNAGASPAAAAATAILTLLRAALGDGAIGDLLTAGGVGVDPAWESPTALVLPTLTQGELLGNAGASPAAAAATAILALLRAALGDGVAGAPLLAGGTGVDPAWGNALTFEYVIGCFVPAVLTASQVLLNHPFTKNVSFPANFGSYGGFATKARGTAAATASTTITVQKAVAASPGVWSNVGTIVVAAGALAAATFTTSGGAQLNFLAGDTLQLVAPATPDTTFAGFSAALVGFEVS
jgi:hypothetical protein